jgi:sugar O-acyltransferase (sialic acid O-acetyltransferase NeuD family)
MTSTRPPTTPLPRDLVIFGAGGMGQEVADLVCAATAAGAGWRLIGFLDDDPALSGREVLGIPVLGGAGWLSGRSVVVSVAVGSPARRRQVCRVLRSSSAVFAPSLVHPSAYVGKMSELGEGALVGAHAVLTVDVKVGAFGIVNVGATVSHNSRLSDFSTIAPGAHLAGSVRIGEGGDIGVGASIVPFRNIGEWCIVGAGAVVVDDVDPNTTVVGCPARVVARRSPGWQG